MGVGERTILKALDLRRGAREIKYEPVAHDCERDLDGDVRLGETIMVAAIRSAVAAWPQGCDLSAHPPLSIVEQVWKKPSCLLLAEVPRQRNQPLSTYSGRPEHRVKITREQIRTAGIGEQQTHNVLAQDTALRNAQRRNSNALMEDFPGSRIVGARYAATDIRLVGAIAREAEQVVIDEDRTYHGPVSQMVVAGKVGIVRQEHIAICDVFAEGRLQGSNRKPATAGMHRNSVRLGGDRTLRISDKTGKIVRLGEDRAPCSFHHHPPHLTRDVIELLLHKGEQNRIHDAASLLEFDDVVAGFCDP